MCDEIDDSFYSRQRYVVGDQAMLSLSTARVYICGLGGVGVEIAKNLALAGIKDLIIDDPSTCTIEDCASQFFVRPEHISQRLSRAEASLNALAALNPYVNVTLSSYSLTCQKHRLDSQLIEACLRDVDCLILTDCHIFYAAFLNKVCRENSIRFIYTNTMGVLGNIFCDFGTSFTVLSPDEEPPLEFFIESIENAERPKLVIKGQISHKLPDFCSIVFREVRGMTELNGRTVKVKVISPLVIELDIDTRNFGKFTGSGIATEVKPTLVVSHIPLAKQIEKPSLSSTDLVDPASSSHAHVAFITLMIFMYEKHRLPRTWCKKDILLFTKLAERFCFSDLKVDTQLLEKIASTCRGQLAPLCSFFGGVAAQEAIKAVTHQFTPLNQWMYLVADAVVPETLPQAHTLRRSSRYDPIVACIGPENMEKLVKARAFVVGCGAIGCELLKIVALLGLSTGVVNSQINNSDSFNPDEETSEATASFASSDLEPPPLVIRSLRQLAEELSFRDVGVIRVHRAEVSALRRHEPGFGDTSALDRPVGELRTATSDSDSQIVRLRPVPAAQPREATNTTGPRGEPAADLGDTSLVNPLPLLSNGSVTNSASSDHRFDERSLRLPMITRISSHSDYDADLESLAQQPRSYSVQIADSCAGLISNANASNSGEPCVTVTDMDYIEKSNLNRQFLFRPEHVGLAKSTVAAQSVRQINPALKVNALVSKLGPETEQTVFTDAFLQAAASGDDKANLPIVLAALDNIEARNYLDARCVANRLAMFESGTQGTKGHTQVVFPGLTESYSSQGNSSSGGADGDGDAIPYCTLKSFPAKPVDCIEWAREKFFTQFTLKPRVLEQLLKAFSCSPSQLLTAFKSVIVEGSEEEAAFENPNQRNLIHQLTGSQVAFFNSRPRTWQDCIRVGREKFEKYFKHKALHLLYKFPPDATVEDGKPFWQLPRRSPTPIQFDASNQLHTRFVWTFARLLAYQSDIEFPALESNTPPSSLIAEALADFTPAPFTPSQKEVVTDTSVKAKPAPVEPLSDSKAELQTLLKVAIERLQSRADRLITCRPIEFDKDNEADGHVDFMDAAANLRAQMYGLPITSRYEVKRIAGRIIPAIATTTAAVAGLISLELLKYVCCRSSESLLALSRNHFVNLSLPSTMSVLPAPCRSTKLPNGMLYTIWDRWELQLPSLQTSLKDTIDAIKAKYGLEASLISRKSRPIYMSGFPKFAPCLKKPVLSLIEPEPGDAYVDLVIAYEAGSEDALDVEGPPFRLILPIPPSSD
uniref:UBA_e1_C domain-containing protein n=2 Tax=Mesocestoides corti TaxID=53468 RepID=A0A5K3EGL9_MESCO